MLYCQDLEDLVFSKNQYVDCDELLIISGYVGPNPILRLGELPIKTTVVYGMYGSEGIKPRLHSALMSINSELNNVSILYSQIPVHSKIYIWLKNSQIMYVLIGSANFSTNGLCTPFKEVLADTPKDTFKELRRYIDKILNSSVNCEEGQLKIVDKTRNDYINVQNLDPEICDIPLFDMSTGEVQSGNGLNWGQCALTGSHVNIDDANIAITKNFLRAYPQLFPEKQMLPRNSVESGRINRHNDAIDIIWDDGTNMKGLLEGNQKENGKCYPKQICSHPKKKILGQYIRKRLGLKSGEKITKQHLDNYGRTTISISLLSEGVYYFDFSVKK